jgi:signal transduction histidine kinase
LYWKEVQDEKGLLDPISASLRLPLNDSISGSVYQTGEPVLLNNPSEDSRFFKPFETISGFQIRNEILVPLNTREDTIGVLTVFNKKSGQFSEEDVHVCSSLAGVVAMAVENARFFRELLDSYNELEQQNKAKSKILNHLSHELRTPLAIIHGTLSTMEKRMEQQGVTGFEKAMERMNRHVLSLNRLESQVESIMMTGYSWQKRHITGFLQKALDLIDVQAEYTPEIEKAAMLMREWMEKTFPTSQDELELINIKQFSQSVFEYVRSKADREDRKVELNFDLENHSRLLIPGHVLQAIVEGLVRNAIEATPDNGRVDVTGRVHGDRYIFKVTDTGIGIPEGDRGFIFEGFYPVQDTEDYRSGRPYSFNAGGKGIDLLRIRMFSELYDFNISFTSSRCPYLQSPTAELPGDVQLCTYCQSPADCANNGGSEFVVDFKLSDQSGDSDN